MQMAVDSYQQALSEWRVAQHQFEYADPDHIDIAIHKLQAAELKLAVALKERRDAINVASGRH